MVERLITVFAMFEYGRVHFGTSYPCTEDDVTKELEIMSPYPDEAY